MSPRVQRRGVVIRTVINGFVFKSIDVARIQHGSGAIRACVERFRDLATGVTLNERPLPQLQGDRLTNCGES
jgi:hypothetical protein